MSTVPRKKIRYVQTNIELGETHTEQKEEMYRVWGHLTDVELARFGLKRTDEDDE